MTFIVQGGKQLLVVKCHDMQRYGNMVDIYIRIAAAATAAILHNRQAWQDLVLQHRRFTTKYKLYKSLVVPILLYGCEM